MNSNKQNIHTSSLKLENTIKGMKGRIAVKDAFASLNGKVTRPDLAYSISMCKCNFSHVEFLIYTRKNSLWYSLVC